tara:strand:- start:191 stop:1063 length:873 start_codon:yes stop_codon:yes gene_type:complete
MSDFMEVVSANRPQLKPGSLKSYNSAFNKALKTEVDILEPEKMIEALVSIPLTTRRNVFNVLSLYTEKSHPLLSTIYATERDKLNLEYVKQEQSGIISDKQSPNFITYKELENFVLNVRSDIDKDRQTHMSFVILNFLINRPLRNDLAGVRLMTPRMFKKLKEEERNECYIISQGTNLIFYCNQFATTKTRPQEELSIQGTARIELQKYIKKYKIKSGEIIFPISKNAMSQLLIRTSQKYIQKNISTTIIRKIVSSHNFLTSKQQQEAHSKSIGHSVAVDNLIYVKEQQF